MPGFISFRFFMFQQSPASHIWQPWRRHKQNTREDIITYPQVYVNKGQGRGGNPAHVQHLPCARDTLCWEIMYLQDKPKTSPYSGENRDTGKVSDLFVHLVKGRNNIQSQILCSWPGGDGTSPIKVTYGQQRSLV